MSERVPHSITPSGEAVTPAPLVLRGHHLELIHDFYYPFVWGRKRTTTQFAEHVAEVVADSYDDPSYAVDVLGRTSKEARRFKRQTAAVVRRFIELPDEYPLELVEGVPDDICAGCAVGEHCRKLYQGGHDNPDIIDEDRKWISWFVNYSYYYSDNVRVSVEQETAYFSDAEPQEVRRIKTKVGAIRNAMPYWF